MKRTGASNDSRRDAAREIEMSDEAVVALITAHRRLVKAVVESRDCIRLVLRARERQEVVT